MSPALDFGDVRGNLHAIGPVLDAVRSRRGLVLTGPPGCGKTMLAARIPGIMGPLDASERAQVIARLGEARLWPDDGTVDDAGRPFRAPHHSISAAGLRAESRIARCGVLLLDEVDQFRREAMAVLAGELASCPAWCRPLLVLACNPGADLRVATRLLGAGAVVQLEPVRPGGDGERWPPTGELLEEVARCP